MPCAAIASATRGCVANDAKHSAAATEECSNDTEEIPRDEAATASESNASRTRSAWRARKDSAETNGSAVTSAVAADANDPGPESE